MMGFPLDAQGDLPEQGEHQRAHGVYAEGHGNLLGRGHVRREGFKHVGRETADEQAQALVDPAGGHQHDQRHGSRGPVRHCGGIRIAREAKAMITAAHIQ